MEVDQRRIVVDDQTGVLQPQKGDEQADAGRDCRFNGFRDRLKNDSAQSGDGQKNKNDSVDEDHNERVGIRKAHSEANRIDEECVQTHARSLRQRQLGHKSDEQRADNGGNGGGDVHGVVHSFAKTAEHTGVDHQDVRHGHKRRDAGKDLRAYCGMVFLKPKKLVHNIPSTNSFPDAPILRFAASFVNKNAKKMYEK